MKIKSRFIACLLLLSFTACGSGGGGGGSDSGSPDPVDSSAGGKWRVSAEIALDGCGDRISDVNQTFAVTENGGALRVNTGIVRIAGTKTDSGFTTGFSETNGTCHRRYTADFAYTSDTTATVELVSNSNC